MQRDRLCQRLALGAASLWLIHGASGAAAAEWQKSASVSVGSYYTTNVCRSPNDEQEDTVGTFRPRVAVSGRGARASVNLQLDTEYNSLAEKDLNCPGRGLPGARRNREPWVPRVSATGVFEAVENWLTLDANARATQAPVNPFLPGGDENLNAFDNTNLVYSYGAGATLRRQIASALNLSIRYDYNEQFNSRNRLFGDSQQERVVFDLGMIPAATRLSVGTRGQYSEVTFDSTGVRPEFTNRLARAELYANLRLTRSLFLQGSFGKEDNAFLSRFDDIDDTYWDAGLRWQPNSRVNVTAGYGERFFGETPRASISYRHKRSTLLASYARNVRFPRNLRQDNPFIDAPDRVEVPPGFDGPLEGVGLPTFIGQGPVINEQALLSWRFTGRRGTLNVRVSDSRQTQLSTGFEGGFQRASVNLDRRLAPSLTGFAGLAWNRNERVGNVTGLDQPVSGFERWRFDAGVSRPLGRRTRASLRYSFFDQTVRRFIDAADAGSAQEHRLTLTINHQLL